LKVPKTGAMLRREAAAWLARLQSSRDPDVERKFHRWRDLDPSHAEAFERVSRSYEQAGLLRYSHVASTSPPATPLPVHTRSRSYELAIAAGLVLLLCTGLYLLVGRGFWTSGTEAVMLSTKVGEIRSVSLADGSKLTLDTDTSIEVEIDRNGRKARVKAGRARFNIAKAAQPFIIDAGNTTASAAAAVLDVEKFGDQARVDVISGSAKIGGSDAAGLRLGAGETMTTLSDSRVERRAHAPAQDWTRGMLEFDGTALGSAVELANRYSERKIILGAGLEHLKVTGAFRAGDVKGLAGALAEAFHLKISRGPGGNLVLSPKFAERS